MPLELSDDDVLYRKIEVGQYDEQGVLPEAFIDRYEAQSFFKKGLRSPREVLEFFAGLRGIRRRFGRDDLSAEDLFDAGIRIAQVSVRAVKECGCSVRTTSAGDEFNPKTGHVDVADAKRYAEELALAASLLSAEETLKPGT